MSVKKVGYYRNYYGNKDRKGALDEEIWADFHKQQEEEEKKKFSSDEMIEMDMVNNPPHYNAGAVECIDAIQASMSVEAFQGYLKGNILKYIWRYESKGGVEDLKKAKWYLTKLIEVFGFEVIDSSGIFNPSL